VVRLTLETFRVTQSLDFARVDFRLHAGENLRPYIIEINSLPGLTPISDLTLCAQAEGWSYESLIQSVLTAGAKRYGLIPSDGGAAEAAPRSGFPSRGQSSDG